MREYIDLHNHTCAIYIAQVWLCKSMYSLISSQKKKKLN